MISWSLITFVILSSQKGNHKDKISREPDWRIKASLTPLRYCFFIKGTKWKISSLISCKDQNYNLPVYPHLSRSMKVSVCVSSSWEIKTKGHYSWKYQTRSGCDIKLKYFLIQHLFFRSSWNVDASVDLAPVLKK